MKAGTGSGVEAPMQPARPNRKTHPNVGRSGRADIGGDIMNTAQILEQVLDPLTECLTPEAARKIVALRADPQTQSLFEQLADKANEGTLSDKERSDYDKLRATFHLVSILQSRARRVLQQAAG